MSKIIKVLDTEHIEIREYRNPNLVFNTNEYDINDKICILREVINPFIMQQQIQELTNNWNELRQHIKEYLEEWENSDDEWVKGKCDMARDILYDMEEIKVGKK